LRLQDCPYPCSAGIVSGSPRPNLLLSFLQSSSAEGGRSWIADQYLMPWICLAEMLRVQ
ncbi:hypothetical protein T01_2436, partial [Trichinella spiralis]